MITMKSVLAAAGLFGGLVLAAGSASAVPAGPSGVQAGAAPVTQVMMRGERMMMKKRMMRREMMKRRMMRKRMMMKRM